MAIDVAKEAGKLGKAAFTTSKRVENKSCAQDLVTETDRAVESLVQKLLACHFPDHKFIGEESHVHGNGIPTEPTWIVDPIDGTTNFVHGYLFYCIKCNIFFLYCTGCHCFAYPLDFVSTGNRWWGLFTIQLVMNYSRQPKDVVPPSMITLLQYHQMPRHFQPPSSLPNSQRRKRLRRQCVTPSS